MIKKSNTLVPVGIVLGSNPGSTSTSYTSIPTRGCTLPNMGFPYGGAHQGQDIQVINLNPFGLPNTYLGSNSKGNLTPWNGKISG